MEKSRIHGVLLAAGRSERFGRAKLHVPLPKGSDSGVSIGVVSCRNLVAALHHVTAVVRRGDDALGASLAREGARVVVAARADEGIGASLAAGVAALPDASGYIVALADMPFIAPATIERVAQAIRDGASVAAPRYRGERGHPVGFAATHRQALLALVGDEGARRLIAANSNALTLIDVDDPGVVRDVDTPQDLVR